MKIRNKKQGFTLIEMLIVIGIIGILAVGLGKLIIGGPQKARDAARKSAVGQLVQAIEAYNSDEGHYPGTAGADPYCFGAASATDAEKAIQSYFPNKALPKDPSGASKDIDGTKECDFIYVRLSDGKDAKYVIYSRVEDAKSANVKEYVGKDAIPAAATGADKDTLYAVVQ